MSRGESFDWVQKMGDDANKAANDVVERGIERVLSESERVVDKMAEKHDLHPYLVKSVNAEIRRVLNGLDPTDKSSWHSYLLQDKAAAAFRAAADPFVRTDELDGYIREYTEELGKLIR